MFPADWRLAADLCQRMLTAENAPPASPSPAGRDGARLTPTAPRRQLGAAIIRIGRRLEGGRPLDPVGQASGLAAPGASK